MGRETTVNTTSTTLTPAEHAEAVKRYKAKKKELAALLKTYTEIDCLNPEVYILVGAVRLELLFSGHRDSELAKLNKCWIKAVPVEEGKGSVIVTGKVGEV